MNAALPPSFDIFCRVVDNYGDIGVCWRLARQLAQRHAVRLWVDDLRSFARIEPAVVPQASAAQTVNAVEICRWEQAEDTDIQPRKVVIEAFACELPPAYRARIRPGAHRWLNLEYLSAEPWVEGCHGLPSPQAGGVVKHFFFPGFTPRTGGLLREPGLIARRDAWRRDPAARTALLRALGLPAPWIAGVAEQGWRQVYAFCYPNAPLQSLVDACQTLSSPTLLLAAPGAPATRAQDGKVMRFDCPFVSQDDFDALLWSSHLNCVRGEDSFVRAIWAGQPFLWQTYPQQEDEHLHKLDAWLDLAPCPAPAAAATRAWNSSACATARDGLSELLQEDNWHAWQAQAARFTARQAAEDDLGTRLLRFTG
jgi:uncharacterized repeat protein (TIGR03837 family)